MYDTDVMFLTGAGASMPTGIPGMRGMARQFEQDMKGSEYATTYRTLRDLVGTSDVEEILQVADTIENFEDGPVRDLVSQCIAPRGGSTLDDFDERFDRRFEEIKSFRQKMYDWITEICWRFDREKAAKLYGDIVSLAADQNIPIFTTNYDAVLDDVAAEQGIPIVDNFYEGDRGRQYWDDTLGSFKGEGLRIIKIHGSIQWHMDPNGSVEKINHKAESNYEGDPLTRLLIFPTRFKDIYQSTYFPLYSAFTRTLGKAEVLVVIGHSLRDKYLKAAIRERLRRGNLSVIYVGPKFEAKEELLEGVRASRENQVVHLNKKIQDVYPLICQLLREVPTEDMKDHIDDASDDLSRGRKEKVDVDELPVWVEEGERVEFVLEVDTIVGGGEVRALANPNGKTKKLKWLPIKAKDDSWPNLEGMGSYRIPVTTIVPTTGADSYRVKFTLSDLNGDRVDRKIRKFRIRKNS